MLTVAHSHAELLSLHAVWKGIILLIWFRSGRIRGLFTADCICFELISVSVNSNRGMAWNTYFSCRRWCFCVIWTVWMGGCMGVGLISFLRDNSVNQKAVYTHSESLGKNVFLNVSVKVIGIHLEHSGWSVIRIKQWTLVIIIIYMTITLTQYNIYRRIIIVGSKGLCKSMRVLKTLYCVMYGLLLTFRGTNMLPLFYSTYPLRLRTLEAADQCLCFYIVIQCSFGLSSKSISWQHFPSSFIYTFWTSKMIISDY